MDNTDPQPTATATAPQIDVVVRGTPDSFLQTITTGKHYFRVDEPENYGGGNAAPTPYDYLLGALGACTSMTVGLYARRKKIPLQEITVFLSHSRIHAKDCEDCETKEGMLDRIEIEIELNGKLSQEQRAKLMEIAAKCPVHRTLVNEIQIKHRPAPSIPATR